MEIRNDELGVSFDLPDKITVRMQLAYMSNAGLAYGQELFERYWLGAISVVQNWKCDLVPEPAKLDLDNATNPKITNIVLWVGMEVKRRIDALEDVSKN